MNKSKKLGVLGGMGPGSTADFFARIVRSTDAQSDQEHINMIILNHASVPDRTLVIESGDYQAIIPLLTADAQFLEKAGASAIAIPCNTAYFFYDEIQSKISIPIIHMIRESVNHVVENYPNVKKIGIMATDGTLQTKLYENECRRFGVEAVTPGEESQKTVMRIIYDEVKKGKEGDLEAFKRVLAELKAMGADVVILACTELSYFNKYYDIPAYCVDAMDVLVKKSIEMCGGKYRTPAKKDF